MLIIAAIAALVALVLAVGHLRQALERSELISLDASTGHLVPGERPQLVARSIELMAQGDAPDAVATALPDGLVRPGEGPASG